MQRVLEISLSRPIVGVIQHLEAARKEMAPKIIICKVADDKSWFVCRIEYGYSYAIVTGQAIRKGTATCVSVDVYNLDALPILTIGLIASLAFSFADHPKISDGWGLVAGFWFVVIGLPLFGYLFQSMYLQDLSKICLKMMLGLQIIVSENR